MTYFINSCHHRFVCVHWVSILQSNSNPQCQIYSRKVYMAPFSRSNSCNKTEHFTKLIYYLWINEPLSVCSIFTSVGIQYQISQYYYAAILVGTPLFPLTKARSSMQHYFPSIIFVPSVRKNWSSPDARCLPRNISLPPSSPIVIHTCVMGVALASDKVLRLSTSISRANCAGGWGWGLQHLLQISNSRRQMDLCGV